ncbi:MAG: HAD-IIA family hydrolase [bacterium]
MAIYIFDLDGVIYRGKKVIDGAPETLKILRERGHNLFFLTNDTSKTREGYVAFLKRMGVQCVIEEIMTAAYATAIYFERNNILNTSAFVIGGKGLKEELKNVCVEIIENSDCKKKVDYVIVGLDKTFNYKKLVSAQQLILSGANFIATNNDFLSPKENLFLPGAGTLVSAIQSATGCSPIILGKPEIFTLELILNGRKDTGEVILVGDTLQTDILAGNRIGARTVLVLTGVTTFEEAQQANGIFKPNVILKDITKLVSD